MVNCWLVIGKGWGKGKNQKERDKTEYKASMDKGHFIRLLLLEIYGGSALNNMKHERRQEARLVYKTQKLVTKTAVRAVRKQKALVRCRVRTASEIVPLASFRPV